MKKLLYIKDSEEFWRVFSKERKKTRRKLRNLPFTRKVEILSRMQKFFVKSDQKIVKNIHIPDYDEFHRGCEEFKKHEKRDALYKVATFLISYFWGKPVEMAEGLGVLLLTWNQAFYRYGVFDFDKLKKCVADNLLKIESFRKRDIRSLSNSDEENIRDLFDKFLRALQIDSGRMKGRGSPVAVTKALHLLAPDFFPLWDDKIARAYSCYYSKNPAEKYVSFCNVIKTFADRVKYYISCSDKTLLKLIDEYNYAKYTQGWI